MKTKVILLIIILVSFFACKTKEQVRNTDVRATQETLLEDGRQRETSSDVSGSMLAKTETQTERTERQSGGSIQLSPPDSTGAQYPVVVNWYKNEALETSKISAEIEAAFKQKVEILEKQFTELQEKFEHQSKEKTVLKTGFTLLEKIGFVAGGLLVLIVIFMVVKWLLKFRK